MLTVLEAIKLSTEFLDKKGISEARVNAELLLAEILNCKRLQLYLSFDRPLSNEETDIYREHLARRAKYEPLQYITGNVEFMGSKFYVTKDVLIPRPETEIMVEHIIEEYKNETNLKICDVGTGSGNIAVSLSKNLVEAQILALDKSEEAVALAKQNAFLNDVSSKIQFRVEDIFNFSPDDEFDLIVSNPPYVDEAQYSSLQEEIIKYEPKMAVSDSDDGYSFYKRISAFAETHLKKKGKLFFEVGIGQSQKVKIILEEKNFSGIKVIKDYSGIDRVISGEKT